MDFEYQNFEGSSVDEAITEASMSFGVPSAELVYEVVDEGSSGFLGIGKKPAIIKARVKQEGEEELIKAAKEKEEKAAKEEKKPKFTMEVKEEQVNVDTYNNKTSVNKKPEVKKPKKEFKPKVEEKPVVKEEKKYEAPAEVKTEPVVESKPKVEREIITPSNLDEVISKTEAYLADIFKAMKVDTKIEITFNKEYNDLDIDLSGEEMGLLIGKRGATLDSIQYLTSLYTNKISDQYVRVKIDTEGYRARRKKTLEHLARNVARKVAKTRRPVYLEPMNPYERRIIHSALQNDRYVVTRSEGEEPYRKVVIVLKDRRR
ncbi:MAG: Jag N-terminal domain-containing protein [Lachnospiraceae bacterium]|nr:Jag N-terminal domain-containing protein [Lachnospiraceae bacterium]